MQILTASKNAEKRDLAQRVAEFVALNGFDGVVMVGETWRSPMRYDEEGAFIPPAESPDREEALLIHAEDAQGRVRTVSVPFARRRTRRTVVGEPQEIVDSPLQFLDPMRAVWRNTSRPPPATESNAEAPENQPET